VLQFSIPQKSFLKDDLLVKQLYIIYFLGVTKVLTYKYIKIYYYSFSYYLQRQ
jgi:hypothetical protein